LLISSHSKIETYSALGVFCIDVLLPVEESFYDLLVPAICSRLEGVAVLSALRVDLGLVV
jgi:hypothetical protein